MTLRAQMADDAPLFVGSEDFGEEVLYLAPNLSDWAEATSLQISVVGGEAMLGYQKLVVETEAQLLVAKVLLPVILAGAKIRTAEGIIYHFAADSVVSSDPVFWRVKVARDPQATFFGGY